MKPDLGPTYGALLIGTMVALVLYGFTTLQTYIYYMCYPKDRWSFRGLVACVWLMDTLQIVFCCRMVYIYLINDVSQAISSTLGIWPLYGSLTCNIVIATLVQLFFTIQIHILAKKWWLTITTSLLITAHVVFGIDTVLKMITLNAFGKVPPRSLTWSVVFPFALFDVVPDVLISASLCYLLQSGKGDFYGTNTLINQLMIYAINRALLTAVAAILELVLFATMPTKLYFLAVDVCLGKFYANSLLATLNYRNTLREHGFGKPQLSSAFDISVFRTDFPSNREIRNDDLELPTPINSLRIARSQTNNSLSNNFSIDERNPAVRRDGTQHGQGVVELTASPATAAADGCSVPFSTRAGVRD